MEQGPAHAMRLEENTNLTSPGERARQDDVEVTIHEHAGAQGAPINSGWRLERAPMAVTWRCDKRPTSSDLELGGDDDVVCGPEVYVYVGVVVAQARTK